MAAVSLMQSAPGPETVIDGVRYLYFAGTSYLGLAAHPEVIEAGCAAMRKYGVHSATTRARFGTNPPVLEVEQRAASFFGCEDSFYFVSGYLGNHVAAAVLASEADAVLVEEAAHYSVIDAAGGAGLPVRKFRNRDPEALAAAAGEFNRVVVLADAIGPATGLAAPVKDYMDVLESRESAALLLDDAHGFGVLGPQGRGLLDELGLWPRVNKGDAEGLSLYVCGTLSKALGGFGGIVPGTSSFVAASRKSSHFYAGASAPPSAAAGATAKALELVMQYPSLRENLRRNILHLREKLRSLGIDVPAGATAHLGIEIGDAANMMRIHEQLKARGIMVPYMAAYSGISSEGVLRLAVFANHTLQQIDHLINELGQAL